MTITSKGYDGSVNEVDWATLSRLIGTKYCVDGDTDWKVTVGASGTLPLVIAAGNAFGCGVMDNNSAAINTNGTTVGSGVRWDTVCIHRDWSTNTSSVVIRQGTSAQALAAGVLSGPGVSDDQPLALIKIQAGFTAVQQVIDLRQRSGKLLNFETEAGLLLGRLQSGDWGYARDTDTLWRFAPAAGGTLTLQNRDAPAWVNLSLPGSVQPDGTPPQVAVINGIAHLGGAWQRNPAGNDFVFNGGSGGNGVYSLGNLPVGARPGFVGIYPVSRSFQASSPEVFVQVNADGTVQGIVTGTSLANGSTSRIRCDGITYPVHS